MAKLGWDTRSIDLSKPDNIRAFAAEFKKAMDKGIKVKGFDPVGGQGDAMEQRKSPKEVASMFKKNGYNALMAREYMSERNWPQEYADAIAKELEEDPTEKKEPKEKKKEPSGRLEEREHGSVTRLEESNPQIYQAIEEKKYKTLPNEVSIEVASEIVGHLGVDKAQLLVLDKTNGIPGAVRSMMFKMVIKQLDDAKEYQAGAAFFKSFANDFLKDAGQMIQAMREMSVLYSPTMIFASVEMVNEEMHKKNKSKSKWARRKLKKEIDTMYKEATDQILGSPKAGRKVNKVAQPQQKPSGKSQIKKAFRGENNKVVKRSDLSGLWAEARSYMSVGPTNPAHIKIAAFYIEAGARGFAAIAEEVSKELGNKAVPYFKEAYKSAFKYLKDNGVDVGEPDTDQQINDVIAKLNTQDLVEQLKKAIAKNDQKKSSEILSQLQEQAKGMDAWGAYRDYAVNRVKRMADQEIADARDSSDEMRAFTDGLVRNMTAQMREESDAQGVEPKKRTKPKTDIEMIGEAFRNFEKYEQVWKDVQSEWKRRLNAAKARLEKAETPEAKEKAEEDVSREQYRLEKLDAYFGDLLAKPFSEAGIGRAVRKGLKDLGANINDIIRSHYTVQDNTRRSLQQKLIGDAGLTEPEATELAKAVGEEFDRVTSQRKKEILDQFLSRSKKAQEAKALREKGGGQRASRESAEERFMKLVNTGALDNEEFAEHYGELMGWSKVTPEQVSKMKDLASKAQLAPKGRPQIEATEDLMKYQESMVEANGWDVAKAMWYANTLSGFQTQEVNFLANWVQMMGDLSTVALKTVASGNFGDIPYILGALNRGLSHGAIESRSTMSTGRSPIRGKIEMPSLLERRKFTQLNVTIGGREHDFNPLNYLKFVRRVMVAADTFFYEGNKEMWAQYAAMKQARTLYPSQDIRQKSLDIMNRGDQAINEAKIQANEEYNKEVEEINANTSLTKIQRDAELGRAKFNSKRRVFELVELGRPSNIREDSAYFAERATYNHPPTGALGAIAYGVRHAAKWIPGLWMVIPFVDVIANVANRQLDYTPIGYLRAARKGQITDFRRDHMTTSQMEEVRTNQVTNATIGMMTFIGLFLASGGGDDDDPLMEVTANGYGSWTQNRGLATETGWQEYSFRFRGSKTWTSYQYTPLMGIFALIGHHNDAKKYRKAKIDDNYMTAWALASGRTVASFSDATMLGSMKDLLKAMGNETSEDVVGGVTKTISRIGKNLVPYAALYTQTARGVEAMNKVPLKDVRNDAWGYLIQDVPVLRDALHDQLNWLGEPILPEGGYFPRFLSTQKSDPIADLLTKNVYTPSVPQAGGLSAYDPNVDKERYFTKDEQFEFYKERGAYIKMKMEEHMDELKTLDKEDFADEMGKISRAATIHSKGTIVIHVNKTKQHKAFYYFPVKK